jgi:hypothetical protein
MIRLNRIGMFEESFLLDVYGFRGPSLIPFEAPGGSRQPVSPPNSFEIDLTAIVYKEL